jgi:hypothetical protein
MTTDITPENVARMLDGVTDGPWMVTGVRGKLDGQSVHNVFRYDADKKRDEHIAAVWYDTKNGLGHADARFIAYAREAVPALSARLAEVEAPCTDCEGSGITLQTERHCACDAGRSEALAARLVAAEAENAKLLEALTLVLPLAKGYAAANRHDINRRVIEIAEAALQVKP